MTAKKKKILLSIGGGIVATLLATASVLLLVGDKKATGEGETPQSSVSSISSSQSSTSVKDESDSSSSQGVLSSGLTESSIESNTDSAGESSSREEEASSSGGLEETPNIDWTKAAPSFTLQDTNGRNVELSDLYGKPVVVNFWATWCPPCRAELPDFQAAYERYGEEVQFLMVATMWDETATDVMNFVSDNGYTFPIYYDAYGEGTETYEINGIPMSLFIDRSGELKYAYNYMITEDLLTASIQEILK